jgi:hypothetical protein
MEKMGSFRTRWRSLRLALAGLLAAVSLVQMPSMVMAWSDAGATYHQQSATLHSQHSTLQSSHQHHAQGIADDAFEAGADIYGTFACHIVGCCLALNPVVCGAPSASDQLIGPLDRAPPRVMLPAVSDPADPPPRFLS